MSTSKVYVPDPEARTKAIGASEAAAICGFDPWRSALDIFMEKTGRLHPDTKETSHAALLGHALEPMVLDWAESKLGTIRRTVEIKGIDTDLHFPLVVHLDGLLESNRHPVEAKTHGILSPPNLDLWGEEGSDEVPKWILIQCMTQMIALGVWKEKCVCHVPVFIGGGKGFRMYHIPFKLSLAHHIIEVLAQFWNDHVLKDDPPDGTISEEIAKRIKREPGKVVTIDPELFGKYDSAAALMKQAKAEQKAVKEEILTALNDAEGGTAEGVGTFTFMEVERAAYEVAASTYFKLTRKKA